MFLFNLYCAAWGKVHGELLVLISPCSLQPPVTPCSSGPRGANGTQGRPACRCQFGFPTAPLLVSHGSPAGAKIQVQPLLYHEFHSDFCQQLPSWPLCVCQCPDTIPFFAGLPHSRKISAFDPVMQGEWLSLLQPLIQVGEKKDCGHT